MKFRYCFKEINYGSIEIESDHEPDVDEIINQIQEGNADYGNTDLIDFELLEKVGETK